MFCKYCGKQIADDSNYCQHCGGKIKGIDLQQSECKLNIKPELSKVNGKHLYKWGIIYSIYFIINLILLLSGYEDAHSFKYLWPFGNSYSRWNKPFSPTNYDVTDFLFYAFLIPTCIYGLMRFSRNHIEEKRQTDK
ncbi:MAG: zinc-ribbon domain-containing protein [Bacteroidales bacterium]|nr:zinc-ribbon domain-containing protein [Bacteroidales bacterium]